MNISTSKKPSRTFRPWPQNQMHFEFAEANRFNVSELLNEIVAKHFKRHLEQKVHAQQQAVKALAPARNSKPQLQKSRR
jgi:hypothetical protein